jgi:hypothetical protein
MKISPSVQSSALALLLHKPAGKRGDLIISDAPLEISDLACLLRIQKNDTAYRDYQAAMSGGTRLRKFYYYAWEHEYWNSFYLPPITEYYVTGDAWRAESFAPGKFVYTEKGPLPIPESPAPTVYEPGREITCSTAGGNEPNPYACSGWSYPDPYQQWTEGNMAGLSFPLSGKPLKDLEFRLLGFGYLGNGKITSQVVTVIVNSIPLARWQVSEKNWYKVSIPAGMIRDNKVNIVLAISNPMAPSDFGNSGDNRKLGIAVNRIVLAEKR